jgi:5-carboxymethyl-2-hydroxymuconate isomerase
VATGLFTAADIKSRALRHADFAIGDGAPNQAFVTLNVQILSGRSDDVKAQLSEALLPLLTAAFPQTFAHMKCSLTVQITDIHRPSYCRQIST